MRALLVFWHGESCKQISGLGFSCLSLRNEDTMKIHRDLGVIFDNWSELLQENPKSSLSKWGSWRNFHTVHCKSLKAQYYVSAVGLNLPISNSFQTTWRPHHEPAPFRPWLDRCVGKNWVSCWYTLQHLSKECWWPLRLSDLPDNTAMIHTPSLTRREYSRCKL